MTWGQSSRRQVTIKVAGVTAPTDRRPMLLWGSALILIVSLLYGATLQADINGSSDRRAEDVGEFQNVLAQWGTAHPTGYPLYALSGAAFTSLLRALGVAPAAAASAFSAFVSVGALAGVYMLLCEWQASPALAAGTTLLLAVLFPFWFHASVAEVYAMLIGLIVLAYLIVARWQADRKAIHLYHLAFVVGLAAGHHRLALLALPALAIYAGPLIVLALRERPARLMTAGASFLAAGLVYLYLPIRAWTGGTWLYDQPGTWEGFWRIVTAREYGPLVQPAADSSVAEAALTQVLDALVAGLTWPILIAGLAGLALSAMDKAHRWIGVSLIVLALADAAFVGVFSRAVSPQAALMPAMLALILGLGLLARRIASVGQPGRTAAGAFLAIGVLALIAANGPAIWSITHDPGGRAVINNVVQAQLDTAVERPVVFALWGRDFFALAYAHAVTGELASIDVVDHRADVKTLIDNGRAVYALSPTFYFERRSIDWWDRRLGRAYLSSFSGDLVRVSDRPVLTEADLPSPARRVPMGESIVLRAWAVEPLAECCAWRVTLYWQATAPIDRDYSVFVHSSDRDVIDSPEAIVGQADSSAPVYGWYPTSRWSLKEIVRDDHILQTSSDRPAKIVSVGLYYQDESGAFHDLGQQIIPLTQ